LLAALSLSATFFDFMAFFVVVVSLFLYLCASLKTYQYETIIICNHFNLPRNGSVGAGIHPGEL